MSANAGVLGHVWADADDSALLAGAREGDSQAYAELWRRHLTTAYAVAHRYRGRASAEDIVAEASLRVYDLLKVGKGPTTNFRSYFLSAVKTVAVDLARTDLRVVPSETEVLESASDDVQAYDVDARVNQDLVRTAFSRLPERDQQVLWHTTVEGRSPTAVATTMGLTPNGVSVVALRARDALRARYLDAHADRAISRAGDEECRWVLAQMGRYVRGKLPVRQRARVEEHLAGCARARALALELTEVNRGLPALMVPLIFVAGTSTGAAWIGGLAGAAGGGDSGPRPDLASPLSGVLSNLQALAGKAAGVVVAAALGVGFVAAPGGGFAALSGAGDAGAIVAGAGAGGGGSAGGSGGAGDSAGSGTVDAAPGSAVPVLPPSLDAPIAVAGGPGSSAVPSTSTSRRSTSTPTRPVPLPAPSPVTPPTPPNPAPATPQAAANNPATATAGQAVTLTYDFGTAAGGTITVVMSTGSAGADCSPSGSCTFVGQTGTVTLNPVPTAYPAWATITVTSVGGTTTTTTLPIAPPPDVPPSFPPTNPTTAQAGQPLKLDIVTGSVFGATVTAVIDYGVTGPVPTPVPVSGCGNPCTIAGLSGAVNLMPVPTAYPATLVVTVVNASGQTPVQPLIIPMTPPQPTVSAPSTLVAGAPTTIVINTGDPSGGTFVASIDNGTVSVTGIQPGAGAAAMIATNSCGDAARTVTCSLAQQNAVVSVEARPDTVPAKVTIEVSNAMEHAQPQTIDVTAEPPRFVSPSGPLTVVSGQPFAVSVDTGSLLGGAITATSSGPVAIAGCPDPQGNSCLLSSREATVMFTFNSPEPTTKSSLHLEGLAGSVDLPVEVMTTPSVSVKPAVVSVGQPVEVSYSTGAVSGGKLRVVPSSGKVSVQGCVLNGDTCDLVGGAGTLAITADSPGTVQVTITNGAKLAASTTITVPAKPTLAIVPVVGTLFTYAVEYDMGAAVPGRIDIEVVGAGLQLTPGCAFTGLNTSSCVTTKRTGTIEVVVLDVFGLAQLTAKATNDVGEATAWLELGPVKG